MDAIRQRDEEGLKNHYPDHLQVTEDCYTSYPGSVKRVRLQDEGNQLLAGSVFIREYNYVVQGEMTSANKSWTMARFDDSIARGYGNDIVQYQQFTVQVWGLNATPGPVAIQVREQNGRNYGTLGIKMEPSVVWINGNDGKLNGQLPSCNR